MKNLNLPSNHQLGDNVKLNFFKEGEVTNCTVIKIHFTENKVLYDVEISSSCKDSDERWSTRVYNIESDFIKK